MTAAPAALAVLRTDGRSVGCAAAPKSIAIRRRGVSDGKSIRNERRRRRRRRLMMLMLCELRRSRRAAGTRTACGLRYASDSDRLDSRRRRRRRYNSNSVRLVLSCAAAAAAAINRPGHARARSLSLSTTTTTTTTTNGYNSFENCYYFRSTTLILF